MRSYWLMDRVFISFRKDKNKLWRRSHNHINVLKVIQLHSLKGLNWKRILSIFLGCLHLVSEYLSSLPGSALHTSLPLCTLGPSREGQSPWQPHRKSWLSFGFLASTCPSPNYCGHVGGEPAYENTFPFCFYALKIIKNENISLKGGYDGKF